MNDRQRVGKQFILSDLKRELDEAEASLLRTTEEQKQNNSKLAAHDSGQQRLSDTDYTDVISRAAQLILEIKKANNLIAKLRKDIAAAEASLNVAAGGVGSAGMPAAPEFTALSDQSLELQLKSLFDEETRIEFLFDETSLSMTEELKNKNLAHRAEIILARRALETERARRQGGTPLEQLQRRQQREEEWHRRRVDVGTARRRQRGGAGGGGGGAGDIGGIGGGGGIATNDRDGNGIDDTREISALVAEIRSYEPLAEYLGVEIKAPPAGTPPQDYRVQLERLQILLDARFNAVMAAKDEQIERLDMQLSGLANESSIYKNLIDRMSDEIEAERTKAMADAHQANLFGQTAVHHLTILQMQDRSIERRRTTISVIAVLQKRGTTGTTDDDEDDAEYTASGDEEEEDDEDEDEDVDEDEDTDDRIIDSWSSQIDALNSDAALLNIPQEKTKATTEKGLKAALDRLESRVNLAYDEQIAANNQMIGQLRQELEKFEKGVPGVQPIFDAMQSRINAIVTAMPDNTQNSWLKAQRQTIDVLKASLADAHALRDRIEPQQNDQRQRAASTTMYNFGAERGIDPALTGVAVRDTLRQIETEYDLLIPLYQNSAFAIDGELATSRGQAGGNIYTGIFSSEKNRLYADYFKFESGRGKFANIDVLRIEKTTPQAVALFFEAVVGPFFNVLTVTTTERSYDTQRPATYGIPYWIDTAVPLLTAFGAALFNAKATSDASTNQNASIAAAFWMYHSCVDFVMMKLLTGSESVSLKNNNNDDGQLALRLEQALAERTTQTKHFTAQSLLDSVPAFRYNPTIAATVPINNLTANQFLSLDGAVINRPDLRGKELKEHYIRETLDANSNAVISSPLIKLALVLRADAVRRGLSTKYRGEGKELVPILPDSQLFAGAGGGSGLRFGDVDFIGLSLDRELLADVTEVGVTPSQNSFESRMARLFGMPLFQVSKASFLYRLAGLYRESENVEMPIPLSFTTPKKAESLRHFFSFQLVGAGLPERLINEYGHFNTFFEGAVFTQSVASVKVDTVVGNRAILKFIQPLESTVLTPSFTVKFDAETGARIESDPIPLDPYAFGNVGAKLKPDRRKNADAFFDLITPMLIYQLASIPDLWSSVSDVPKAVQKTDKDPNNPKYRLLHGNTLVATLFASKVRLVVEIKQTNTTFKGEEYRDHSLFALFGERPFYNADDAAATLRFIRTAATPSNNDSNTKTKLKKTAGATTTTAMMTTHSDAIFERPRFSLSKFSEQIKSDKSRAQLYQYYEYLGAAFVDGDLAKELDRKDVKARVVFVPTDTAFAEYFESAAFKESTVRMSAAEEDRFILSVLLYHVIDSPGNKEPLDFKKDFRGGSIGASVVAPTAQVLRDADNRIVSTTSMRLQVRNFDEARGGTLIINAPLRDSAGSRDHLYTIEGKRRFKNGDYYLIDRVIDPATAIRGGLTNRVRGRTAQALSELERLGDEFEAEPFERPVDPYKSRTARELRDLDVFGEEYLARFKGASEEDYPAIPGEDFDSDDDDNNGGPGSPPPRLQSPPSEASLRTRRSKSVGGRASSSSALKKKKSVTIVDRASLEVPTTKKKDAEVVVAATTKKTTETTTKKTETTAVPQLQRSRAQPPKTRLLQHDRRAVERNESDFESFSRLLDRSGVRRELMERRRPEFGVDNEHFYILAPTRKALRDAGIDIDRLTDDDLRRPEWRDFARRHVLLSDWSTEQREREHQRRRGGRGKTIRQPMTAQDLIHIFGQRWPTDVRSIDGRTYIRHVPRSLSMMESRAALAAPKDGELYFDDLELARAPMQYDGDSDVHVHLIGRTLAPAPSSGGGSGGVVAPAATTGGGSSASPTLPKTDVRGAWSELIAKTSSQLKAVQAVEDYSQHFEELNRNIDDLGGARGIAPHVNADAIGKSFDALNAALVSNQKISPDKKSDAVDALDLIRQRF